MKNILLINSSKEQKSPLLSLFRGLSLGEHTFYLFSAQEKKEPLDFISGGKRMYLGPELKNSLSLFLFLFLLPPVFLWQLFVLLYMRYRKDIEIIICLNWNEKIIFTPLAAILKIKIIWLEYPDINYKLKPKFLIFLYRLCSFSAVIITFIEFTKIQLINLGFKKKNIKVIPLGIKLNQPRHQENIFSSLAKTKQSNFSRKYFTIGTITDFSQPNQIENLFQAVKICLEVIPNQQLIIVGEGSEIIAKVGQGKNLTWLAKKIGIDDLVWFVSEQRNLRKWLDSFDIFIITSEIPKLANLEIVLKVMAAELPIIGFRNKGFEDLILENKTGLLVETSKSEILACQIIELYKNKRLCSNLGRNAQELISNNFTIEKQLKEFEKIIAGNI